MGKASKATPRCTVERVDQGGWVRFRVTTPPGYRRTHGTYRWFTTYAGQPDAAEFVECRALAYAAEIDAAVAANVRTAYPAADVSVGLDWLTDTHPELASAVPDPVADPTGCVYLTYQPKLLTLLMFRLPYVNVRFTGYGQPRPRRDGTIPDRNVVRPVFCRAAVETLLAHAWPSGMRHLRSLDTVDRKYWRVVQ